MSFLQVSHRTAPCPCIVVESKKHILQCPGPGLTAAAALPSVAGGLLPAPGAAGESPPRPAHRAARVLGLGPTPQRPRLQSKERIFRGSGEETHQGVTLRSSSIIFVDNVILASVSRTRMWRIRCCARRQQRR